MRCVKKTLVARLLTRDLPKDSVRAGACATAALLLWRQSAIPDGALFENDATPL